METQEKKNKFIELRAQGFSYDRIAKRLKVCKQTLINWSRCYQSEIANLKAVELDTLREKYAMLKRNRIEMFGRKLMAINEELSKRNLKDISTAKLFEIFLKCLKLLENEDTSTVFKIELPITETILENAIRRWEG